MELIDQTSTKVKDALNQTALSDFSGQSRVWIYMSKSELNPEISSEINELASQFSSNWLSHGSRVRGFAKLLFNRFLIFSADAKSVSPSGCSIDASVHFTKDIEKRYQLDFFDRMQLARMDSGGKIRVSELRELPSLMDAGKVSGESLIFDNTVSSVDELLNSWLKPLHSSWIAKVV